MAIVELSAHLFAFAAGVAWLQTRAALPSHAALAATLGLLVVAVVRLARRGPRRCRMLASLGLAVSVGFAYAAVRADVRLADALPEAWEGEDVALVGVIDDLPRLGDRATRFAFVVESNLTPRAVVPRRLSLAWQPSEGDAAREPLPRVRAGERWSLVVRLRRPHGNVNAGGFDLEAWLLERNLRATGYVRSGQANRRIDAFSGRWLDRIQRQREAIRDRIVAALPGAPYAPVIVALAIGDQSGLDERAWGVFNRTGTGHLISISGLHVTVFAALCGGMVFALARRAVALTSFVPARKLAVAVGLAASLVYVLLAGAEVPAQRTLLMLAVTAFGLWLARPGTGLLVWSWALTLVLVIDPWAVIAPGFWLSFFAVGLLIHVGSGRLRDDARASTTMRAARALREAVRAQWAITLGLVPLSLALFQQVSLIGPLANAVAIPAVTFAIVPIALAAALQPFDPPWQLAHAALVPLMRFLEALAAAPWASWAQHEPPRWAVALGIAGVLLCLAPRGVPGRWLGAVALVPLFAVLPRVPPPGAFRLVVLDVGQGTAAVVQTHRRALLYDTGPRWTDVTDAGARIVAPALRAAGIGRIDAMIVSHRDLDHSGGALSILAAVPVGFVTSSLADDHDIVARSAERALHLRCRGGQAWEWDGVRFDVLHPDDAHYADPWRKSNDLSCVLRVTNGASAALLAGDIEAKSEIDLVTSRRDALAADVLVVPHHGSRTSSTSSFVAAVAPRHAVFTVGYRNRFGHPRADVVARYVARDASVHRTDMSGALTFEFGPYGTGPPVGARERAPRYWRTPP